VYKSCSRVAFARLLCCCVKHVCECTAAQLSGTATIAHRRIHSFRSSLLQPALTHALVCHYCSLLILFNVFLLQFIEDTFGHAMLADCKEHGKDAHTKYRAYVLDDGIHSPMVCTCVWI
jgi:hypothetical protein